MNVSKFAGLALIAMAFIGAVAETVAHVQPGVDGVILSTHDVLYTHWPSKLIVAKIHIERALGAWAWDPVAVGILALPAWLLFGLPGAFLFWRGIRRPSGRRREELDEMEESLFLYDSLAARAREEGYVDDDEPRFEPEFASEFDGRPPTPDMLEGLDEPGTPDNPIILDNGESSQKPEDEANPSKKD